MNKLSIMPNRTLIQIIESWSITENPINSTEEILKWIKDKNNSTKVNISKIFLEENDVWYYDKLELGIVNRSKTFFKITGIEKIEEDNIIQQPIIIQKEIGYLGIIGKVINGILYFLMQAKVEPGNLNKIQISPTIQATKSNFMQAHGGKIPDYLEYFSNKNSYQIIVDQIQSEQSSRFWGKRNRNIIIIIEEKIEVKENYKWMTLGQIKELMKYNNLVNMDTRTVLSCVPFALRDYTYKELIYIKSLFTQESFFNSLFIGNSGNEINKIYQYINDVKMMDRSTTILTDLYKLKGWRWVGKEFICKDADFKVVYCDIEIEGREVRNWRQPLIESVGEAVFGLIYCIDDNKMSFLVQTIVEIGCFDKLEVGPSVQLSSIDKKYNNPNVVEKLFQERLNKNEGIIFSGLFSEEGGRFYHEQNRNIIMQIEKSDVQILPSGYFWVDFQSLNILIQFNNCLNIQLRNLLSMLSI